MAAVRLGPKREVALLVLREPRVREEDLEELPRVLGRFQRRADRGGAMREAHANRLVNVQPASIDDISYLRDAGWHSDAAVRTCSKPRSTSSDSS